MKGAGLAGAATVGGMGTVAFSGTVAAGSQFSVEASDITVENNRGEVSEVSITPNLTIDWSHFDEAVGKIFVLVEANVDGNGYEPVFRVTPWLTPAFAAESGSTGPGTNGTCILDFSGMASAVIANYDGVPDYATLLEDYNTTVEDYKDCTNTGGAPGDLVIDDYADDWGYFGPAANASEFEVEDDGSNGQTPVDIRYHFAFQTVNLAMVSYYVTPEDGTVESRLDDAHPKDSLDDVFKDSEFDDATGAFWSDVLVEDISSDGSVSGTHETAQGHSRIVMDGQEYPSVTTHDASGPTDGDAPSLRALAEDTPAILVGETSFAVTVNNTNSDSTSDGTTNADATGT